MLSLPHWVPRDIGTWALILTVFGLIIMYPVAILANMSTPWIKNWWAERSSTASQKRIAKLEKELASIEAIPELSIPLNMVFEGILNTMRVIPRSVHIVIGVIVGLKEAIFGHNNTFSADAL
jgi:hypothetical protein